MNPAEFVLGVDGGGSKTVCWLASADLDAPLEPIGRGSSGPANPQAIGWDAAAGELNAAIDAAFADAGLPVAQVAAACVGLAGGDRESVRDPLEQWAARRQLADLFLATHDALPILAAGTRDSTGVALISGTGSLAFGRTAEGTIARAGGWGYLFGDEGSGYAMALAALRAVAHAADGRGPETQLTARILDELHVDAPPRIVEAVYSGAHDRRTLARLARPVLETAEAGDAVARRIVTDAAAELAGMVVAVARSLAFPQRAYALALSGGVLLNSVMLRSALSEYLEDWPCPPESMQLVAEPVAGAVRLARELLKAHPE